MNHEILSSAINRRVGIIVLGMHRSGTSALTRALNLLGAQLPSDLIGSSEANETGHWEPSAIVSFNDEILASVGSRWDDWRPYVVNWEHSPAGSAFLSRARELLRLEYGSHPLIVMKDPRACRLSRLWLAAMQSEGIEPRAVLPLRSPEAVASSLQRRDLIPGGYAHLLWLRHTLDAEQGSRGLMRAFCAYDDLLLDWRSVLGRVEHCLDINFPDRSPAVEAKISAFLTAKLRHFDDKPDLTSTVGKIRDWSTEVFEVLSGWTCGGENPEDRARLDEIRAKFDAASEVFAEIELVGAPVAGQSGAGLARIHELEKELNISQDEARVKDGIALRVQSQLSELQLILWEKSQIVTKALIQSEEEIGRIRCAELKIADLVRALDASEGSIKSLSELLNRSRAEHDGAVKSIQLLAKEMAALEAREAAANLKINRLSEELAESYAVSSQLRGCCERLTRELDDISAQSAAWRTRLEWLRSVNALMATSPAWWRILPLEAKMAKMEQLVSGQQLFDRHAYLELHTDVRASGMNPFEHYLCHGIIEGRDLR